MVNEKKVRLRYQESDRIVIVKGVTKEAVEQMLHRMPAG